MYEIHKPHANLDARNFFSQPWATEYWNSLPEHTLKLLVTNTDCYMCIIRD